MALPHLSSAGPSLAFLVARLLCLAVVVLWPAGAAAQAGGTITGTVARLSGTGPVPLAGVTVVLTTGSGSQAATPQTTDASGVYTFVLAPGRYFLHTWNDIGFTNEVYNDVLCFQAGCQPERGTPIVVTSGTLFTANFTLGPAGIVSGTITDAATSAPLPGVSVRLVPIDMDPAFESYSEVETDAGGVYIVRGLPAGRYQAFTDNDLGYVDELFDNIPCPGGFCVYVGAIGTPILVAPGVTTGSRDFALDRGGRISGTITDEVTGAPLAGACVAILNFVGNLIGSFGSDCVDDTGTYEVIGLPGGTYAASVFPPSGSDYVWELYDNIPCALIQCGSPGMVANATPIPVALGATTPGRNFALSPGGTIRGRVVDAVSSAPLDGVRVVLATRTATGVVRVNDSPTDTTGQFEFRGLPPGTYYAFTEAFSYPNEIYDDIPCPGEECTESLLGTVGTPITVTAGGVTSGIDFGLRTDLPPSAPWELGATVSNYAVWLSWYPPARSATTPSYLIEAGLTPGSTIVTFPTTGIGYRAAPVGPGRYYVRVRAVNAYGTGPASEEIVVVVAADGTGATSPVIPSDVIGWMSGARLTLSWNPSTSNTSYVVEAGAATGVTNIASIAVGPSAFTYLPVPNGFYFVRVRAANVAGISPPSREVLLNVGSVAAPPGAPQYLRSTVTGSTVALRWLAPYAWLGPVTSYVVRAGSAPGLSNLAQAATGSGTTAVFSGVPPGTYYVRVHAVNGQGAGVASSEVKVVVP